MNTSRDAAAKGTMSLLDKLQHMRKEEQVVSAACFFSLLAQKYRQEHGITATELLVMADRIMNDAEGRRKEFAAAALYLNNEL